MSDSRAPSALSPQQIAERIEQLRPWYQNVHLPHGLSTKALDRDTDIFSGADIPAPLWEGILTILEDPAGKRVLDIGCNAGYMSFEAKKLGASYVLGIDANLGATVSFLDQASFCRDALGLDVDFREASLFEFVPPDPFDIVLFCGVLYHLENFATGIAKVRSFVADGGQVILETASEPVTQTTYGIGYHGDTTTFFVPSPAVLRALVEEQGFFVEEERAIGTRTVLALRAIAAPAVAEADPG